MAAKMSPKKGSPTKLKNGGIKMEIKEELDEPMEDEDDAPVFGPAAMGLKRVGEEMPPKPSPPPGLALNRRGMPARIRKKNRLFFDDDIVTVATPRASPKRTPKPSPVKKAPKPSPSPKKTRPPVAPAAPSPAMVVEEDDVVIKDEPDDASDTGPTPGNSASPDRKTGQRTGMRLRNMLKLPKAHKWVCYEWFYSNIDRPLYCGTNDFLICLEESFPTLAARKLSRVEWCLIRRMMGKPRRCSQAFFMEERSELDRKRAKIRLLQQRKIVDTSGFQDLPNEIPLQLVIGTKVTARLRKPQDGLFSGSIDAVDTSDNTYRITFERSGLGTHSVPDYEVLSHDTPETITLASFVNKFRPRNVPPPPPALAPTPTTTELSIAKPGPMSDRFIGEYTIDLLTWMIRMDKVLERKRCELMMLVLLNREAEGSKSHGQPFGEKFQLRYAATVVRLEEINYLIHDKLRHVQLLLQDVSIAPALVGCASLSPQPFRTRSLNDAEYLIETITVEPRARPISQRNKNLMQQLASLLLLVQQMLTNPGHTPCDVQVLQEALDDIRKTLSPANQKTFEDFVEVHMHHIMFRLNRQATTKHPFVIQVNAH